MFYKNLKLMIFGIVFSTNFFIVNSKESELNLITPSCSVEKIQNNLTIFQGCGPRIGDSAPNFRADTTEGLINFPEDFAGKWIILLSHPSDFTPVCTTEFKKLAEINSELKKSICQLVGLSVDSTFTHKIWQNKLNAESSRKVDFPIISDPKGKIARLYGMIHPNESKIQTVRSTFFIDPKLKIRAIFHYPSSNGRNFDEIKRLLYALQISEKDNVATPANWNPGDKTISMEGVTKDVMPD